MIDVKIKKILQRGAIVLLLLALVCFDIPVSPASASETGSTIKWVNFNIPYSAMDKALNLDIRSNEKSVHLHWVEILAYLGTKYGGNWKKYKAKDMDNVAAKLKSGIPITELTANMKYYSRNYEIYNTVLGNFIGNYAVNPDPSENQIYTQKYGLKVFSPIAAGYGYGHYDDFGDSRSFGFKRRHLGNDLLGTVGTPIVAVEGGYIESMGWNRYGGWRIGIRSFDQKRYYYYAHLRKNHPYRAGLAEGSIVKAGDVIGYLGMTGYSTNENVNGMQKPHLHFGMQLIFDQSQPRESDNEIWINVYNIVNLLQRNRSKVVREGKDYSRKENFIDLDQILFYE